MAYSIDLKTRVLNFVAAGGSKNKAAKVFQVARSTVYVWLGEGDDHVPGKPGPKDARKLDRQLLRQVLEQEPDVMLSELAQRFGVCKSTVYHNVHRLGWVRKKNAALRRKPHA